MQYERFSALLRVGGEAFGICLEEEQLGLLYRHFQELRRWSLKINLIARDTSDEQIVEKHFIDSLALLSLLDENGDYLLDIGTGAGFPGLVCKSARPGLRLSLVEPRLKRVSFLRHVIRTCGFQEVDVLPFRLEDGVDLQGELEMSCVVSRAVTEIGTFLRMCERFRRPGCRVVCMKGPRYHKELLDASDILEKWELTMCREYQLPVSLASRALLVFQ